MPLPKNRSTKYREVSRKTIGKTKKVYLKGKQSKASCAVCKNNLAGVAAKGSATEKSVSRKFGGHLCHSCTARVIKEAARVKGGSKAMDNVDLIYKKYVQQLVG